MRIVLFVIAVLTAGVAGYSLARVVELRRQLKALERARVKLHGPDFNPNWHEGFFDCLSWVAGRERKPQ